MNPRWKEAMAAYKAVICAPKREGEDGWSPPPTSEQWRDKKWSRELRKMWPEYTSIRLEDIRFYSDKSKWCKENAQFYWVAGNQQMWYFSDRNSALLFKLSFGGNVEL
ncbi:hypothetical protein D3C87_755210 [compost metagenome]